MNLTFLSENWVLITGTIGSIIAFFVSKKSRKATGDKEEASAVVELNNALAATALNMKEFYSGIIEKQAILEKTILNLDNLIAQKDKLITQQQNIIKSQANTIKIQRNTIESQKLELDKYIRKYGKLN